MNLQRFTFLAIVTLVSLTTHGQLFKPLGLGEGMGERMGDNSQPRMHIENDKLYVCTNKGLYSKDLAYENSEWQLEGFEDIPLQDYVRKGNDILALRYNKGGGFFFLSHDGGKTYENVTPDFLCGEKNEILLNLVQHPTDSSTILTSSYYKGILCSTDFGQTWKCLSGGLYGYSTGYHPARPSIIYNSGSGDMLDGHIKISYDDGQTWTDHGRSLGYSGDNYVHRPAFHPTHPDRWLAGGICCVFLSEDNGQTWSCQKFGNDVKYAAIWYFSAFDDEHPDTVYMAGSVVNEIKVICSTDGGHSWYPSQSMTGKVKYEMPNDLLQYGDKLLIYSESDVYEISKTELLEQTTFVRSIVNKEMSSPLYALQGRMIRGQESNSTINSQLSPVNSLRKGIYIQNGKKIAVK